MTQVATQVAKQNTLMTHFECVGEFHDTFEHPLHTDLYIECFDKEPDLIPFRIRFLREELLELIDENHPNGNIENLADALCDLSYVTNGAGHCLGLNLDELMKQSQIDISTKENYDNVDLNLINNKSETITKGIETLKNIIDLFTDFSRIRDFEGMGKSLVQLLNETYKLGHTLGFHMDKMYREVHRANMTKVCPTEEDAKKTVEFYLREGRYLTPSYRSKKDYFVVFDMKETKILKNYKWEEPNLKQFF